MKMTLNVNGKPVAITADDPQMPLLYALRDDLATDMHHPQVCSVGLPFVFTDSKTAPRLNAPALI